MTKSVQMILFFVSILMSLSPVFGEDSKPDAAAPEGWPAEARTIFVRSSMDETFQPSLFYAPESDKPIPLLVGLHTWSSNYGQTNLYFLDAAKKFGWALLCPHFRGPNNSPSGCGSDLVLADIDDAMAEAKRRVKIDENRIYLMGGSGGGYHSLLLAGRRPEVWAGVSAWVPITDLAAWQVETKAMGLDFANQLVAVCGGIPGASPEVDRQYRDRSPLTWLTAAGDVPVSINHGIHDGHGQNSVSMAHSLRAFNLLANEKDRLTDDEIETMTKGETIPDSLRAKPSELADPSYDKPILFRRASGNVQITIFDGGHEIFGLAGAAWLNRQRKGQGADWTVPAEKMTECPPIALQVSDGSMGNYEAFPDLLRLKSGELLLAYYAGAVHIGPIGRIVLTRSADEGQTWSKPEVLVDLPDTNERDPSLFQTSRGTILCNFMSFYGRKVTPAFVVRLLRSEDGGRTWSEPITIESPFKKVTATSSPIIELPNGTLLLPVYGGEREDGKPVERDRVALLRSTDDGRTWGDPTILEDPTHDLQEPSLLRLANGEILCAMRPNGGFSRSADGGRSWSPIVFLERLVDCPYLFQADEKTILCGLRHRGQKPAITMMASHDEGRTWTAPFLLADGEGAYPSIQKIGENKFLVVFYRDVPGPSRIWELCFVLDPDGTVRRLYQNELGK